MMPETLSISLIRKLSSQALGLSWMSGPLSGFLWSPARDEVAVGDTMNATGSLYERLSIVDTDGSPPKRVATESVLAFFWSPDGEKIAFVSFDRERGSFTWKYVDRSERAPIELVEFFPSAGFLTMVSFFDQYAYSNSVWSPDSSQILFTGAIGPSSARRNGGSPEGDKVYVLDVKEGAVPKEIAASRVAFWSWK